MEKTLYVKIISKGFYIPAKLKQILKGNHVTIFYNKKTGLIGFQCYDVEQPNSFEIKEVKNKTGHCWYGIFNIGLVEIFKSEQGKKFYLVKKESDRKFIFAKEV